MKILSPNLFASLGLAVLLAVGSSAAAQAACLDNRQIQEAVASGEILSLAQVLASAGVDSSAEILSVQVCDQGGGLVYIIGVLAPSGEAQNLVLSAQ
jgi:hypothetical protein